MSVMLISRPEPADAALAALVHVQEKETIDSMLASWNQRSFSGRYGGGQA